MLQSGMVLFLIGWFMWKEWTPYAAVVVWTITVLVAIVSIVEYSKGNDLGSRVKKLEKKVFPK